MVAWSLPSREAWIEIAVKLSSMSLSWWSLPSQEAWIEIKGLFDCKFETVSLPSQEAWIEIVRWGVRFCSYTGSLPPREVWIEMYLPHPARLFQLASLLPREAWIEITMQTDKAEIVKGRFPRGRRGLKFVQLNRDNHRRRRFPRGKRGLKLKPPTSLMPRSTVASPAGSVD